MTIPRQPAKSPRRGEIWYVKLPSDLPDKNERPVVILSIEARNIHERANTVLVVPLSTTPAKMPSHVPLSPGETGLSEPATAQGENITTVRKTTLLESKQRLRRLSEGTIRRIAKAVQIAMGFPES